MLTAFSFFIDPIAVHRNDDKVNDKNEIILKDELIVHEQSLDVMISFNSE
jgi:hypothetical protein